MWDSPAHYHKRMNWNISSMHCSAQRYQLSVNYNSPANCREQKKCKQVHEFINSIRIMTFRDGLGGWNLQEQDARWGVLWCPVLEEKSFSQAFVVIVRTLQSRPTVFIVLWVLWSLWSIENSLKIMFCWLQLILDVRTCVCVRASAHATSTCGRSPKWN